MSDHSPIEVLPRKLRAHMGHPDLTDWCPTCQERVVAGRTGLCGWCDTPVTREVLAEIRAAKRARAARERAREAERAAVLRAREERQQRLLPARVEKCLQDGPQAVPDLAARLGSYRASVFSAVAKLEREGRVRRVGLVHTSAHPKVLYGLVSG